MGPFAAMGKAPEHHELSDFEVLMHAWERVQAFVMKYGLHVLLGILVVVIGIVLYRTHLLRQQARAYGTWELLGRLEDPSFLDLQVGSQAEQARAEELQEVGKALANHGDAEAARWLLMKRASLLAADGRWDEAIGTYEQILQKYPDTRTLVEPAMAVVLEGAGRYADAAALCERLAPDTGARWVDGGRCRELAGDVDAARTDYRRAVDGGLDDPLHGFAADRLAALDRGELLPAPPDPAQRVPEALPLLVPDDSPVQP